MSKKSSAPKAANVKVTVTPAPEDQAQKPCVALEVGHRACKCGREGCGNGS